MIDRLLEKPLHYAVTLIEGEYGYFARDAEFAPEFLSDPGRYLRDLVSDNKGHQIYRGKRSRVFLLPIEGGRLYVKEMIGQIPDLDFEGGDVIGQLFDRFEREITGTEFARKRGLRAPVFYGGFIRNDLAWLVFEGQGPVITLKNFLEQRPYRKHMTDSEVLEHVGRYVARLHGTRGRRGIRHGDLNLGNLLVLTQNNPDFDPKNPISGIDWEFSDLDPFVLTSEQRARDLNILRNPIRNKRARFLSFDEFDHVLSAYQQELDLLPTGT